jgi:hypothetical protein
MFPKTSQIDKKIGDIATIIDEAQLGSGPGNSGLMPLDGSAADAKISLHDETVTAIQELKDIAQALTAGVSLEEQVRLARRLIIARQNLKLLARAHFEPWSKRK